MFWRYGITLMICTACLIKIGQSSRILAICPRASISHQVVLRGLALALNARGHELVVVTTDPINNPKLKNYTEIDIGMLYNSNPMVTLDTSHWLKSFSRYGEAFSNQMHEILDHPELKKLYAPDSNEKFDLVILEHLYWPGLLPFGKRFDAPVIGIIPMGATANIQYALGNPITMSHPSNWDFYTDYDQSSFSQRISNWITYWQYIYWYQNFYMTRQAKIVQKHMGGNLPDLSEMERNMSLVLVNEQKPISFTKPCVPKMIEINGFHVKKTTNPLPKDLRAILDDATEGFVYMSLGSNMKSNMLPNATLNEIIIAFSRLPYKVLWKFENDILPGKPDNVHIKKWVPQQDVLAHPNLKVFIYQGGLQSTEEAVAHAVPLVGIPTWVDQRMQVDKMVSLGVAKKLSILTINRNNLREAILTVALDKSYKEKMLQLSSLWKHNSQDLLENAIWWIEHVIQNRGATYLHSSTADDPWYQRQDMDIVAFLAAGSTIVLGTTLLFSYKLLIISVSVYNTLFTIKKQKFL